MVTEIKYKYTFKKLIWHYSKKTGNIFVNFCNIIYNRAYKSRYMLVDLIEYGTGKNQDIFNIFSFPLFIG